MLKVIEGYESYSVDEQGNVYNKDGMKLKEGDARGYSVVVLYRDAKPNTLLLHRIVAKAFIPNPDGLPQINHINENKKDNRACNLEWCDCKYNQNYGTANERRAEALRKIKSKPVYCIELDTIFSSGKEASEKLNVCRSSISNACKGKRTKAGGYHWRYE